MTEFNLPVVAPAARVTSDAGPPSDVAVPQEEFQTPPDGGLPLVSDVRRWLEQSPETKKELARWSTFDGDFPFAQHQTVALYSHVSSSTRAELQDVFDNSLSERAQIELMFALHALGRQNAAVGGDAASIRSWAGDRGSSGNAKPDSLQNKNQDIDSLSPDIKKLREQRSQALQQGQHQLANALQARLQAAIAAIQDTTRPIVGRGARSA